MPYPFSKWILKSAAFSSCSRHPPKQKLWEKAGLVFQNVSSMCWLVKNCALLHLIVQSWHLSRPQALHDGQSNHPEPEMTACLGLLEEDDVICREGCLWNPALHRWPQPRLHTPEIAGRELYCDLWSDDVRAASKFVWLFTAKIKGNDGICWLSMPTRACLNACHPRLCELLTSPIGVGLSSSGSVACGDRERGWWVLSAELKAELAACGCAAAPFPALEQVSCCLV